MRAPRTANAATLATGEALADEFVGMYVNKWTIDYGPKGREAVQRILSEGAAAGLVPDPGPIEFVEA